MTILTSCESGSTKAQTASVALTTFEETRSNINYGKDSLQQMDIYLPAGRSPESTKSIVLIHGGSWHSGSKSDFAAYIDSFRKHLPDYAVFNLDYRLVSNQNLFPAPENDIKAAVDFITENAAEYGINKEKLVLLGASAGAHLALLQAYKHPDPKIKAVIDFFGPTDLTTMYQNPWHFVIPDLLKMVTGATPATNANIYQQSSPAQFVTSHSAPTLIFHGGNDYIVDISQSQLLKEKLEKAGAVHEMVVYPKEKHGWYGTILSDSFNRISAFLKKIVQ